ncbi:tyrosine-protein kinase CSK-like isoform X2 [Halichondria panicea]|uniref:tyrosine-protein kinase CSK-like isoform X2 n=1 Tax=Halichondria panicea TaxID=6063 RepID=UPI00312B7983
MDKPKKSLRRTNVTSADWFYGKISRQEAEEKLKMCRNGEFLVRESRNFKGDYTLSIQYASKVEHYHIKRGKRSYVTIDEHVYFENIANLVEHYRQDAHGLCSRLKVPDDYCSVLTSIGVDECPAIVPLNSKLLAKEADISRKQSIVAVWRGEYQGTRIAMRRLQCSEEILATSAPKILKVATHLSSLQHGNIVSFLGASFEDPYIYLVTMYIIKGPVTDFLRSRGRRNITQQMQIDFVKQICSGMFNLESQDVVHSNLAAHNVLMDDDGSLKVSDIGFALIDEDILSFPPSKASIRWRAPEVLDSKRFSCKSDVWSFGILLWEICSYGRVPYPGKAVEEIPLMIENGQRMNPPEDCPDWLCHMMLRTWQSDPVSRPSFADIHRELECIIMY